jgi:cytochrome c553
VEKLFDLPAHVFFVHAPVVLIPIVSVVAVLAAARPSWRRRYAIPLVVATAVALVSTLLAVSSGEAFDEAINTGEVIDQHRDLARTTRLFVIGLFVLVVGMVLAGRRADGSAGDGEPSPFGGRVVHGFAGATVILAVLSTVWIVRTGHEGATVAWEGFLPDDQAVATAPTTTVATTTAPTTTVATTTAPTTTVATTTAPTTTVATTTAPTTTVATSTTTSLAPADPLVEFDGAEVFAANCARCHGPTGEGGRGPSLIGNELTPALIQAQVRVGGLGMISFQDLLSDPEIAAVVEFVEAL